MSPIEHQTKQKYGYNLCFCSWVMVLNIGSVFVEDNEVTMKVLEVTVGLNSDSGQEG